MSEISDRLLEWYDQFSRTLPWRETSDPYKVWISEVMLQQTTVKAVIPYYERWMSQFPNVEILSDSSLDSILKVWQGLGYYSRASNIHKAAKIIVETMDGKIPQDKKKLMSLPGLGEYTASAILSIAFGQKEAVIEANIRRIVLRFLCVEKEATTQSDPLIRDFLSQILPDQRISCFNQALMDLGSLVCRPQNPLCLLCVFNKDCQAFQRGRQMAIPIVIKKKWKALNVSIGIIHKGDQCYIRKRPLKGLWGGLWEFPGGKQEKNESFEETLKREILEELGVSVHVEKFIGSIKHSYTQYKVTMFLFVCKTEDPLPEGEFCRWVGLSEMDSYPMPVGTVKILKKIREKETLSLFVSESNFLKQK